MAMPFCGSSNVQTLSSCAISNHLRTKENENSKAPMGNHKTCIIIAHLICLQIATARALPRRHHHNWLSHGGDIRNRRYAVGETRITSLTTSKLRPKWEFNTGKDITATPAIFDGIVYFPSWNGFIYAVKAADGSLVWKKNLKELTGLAPSLPLENVTSTVSRATPTVAQNKLIVPIYGPAYVVALNRTTGELVWMRQLDRHPAAVITMSGTFYKRYSLKIRRVLLKESVTRAQRKSVLTQSREEEEDRRSKDVNHLCATWDASWDNESWVPFREGSRPNWEWKIRRRKLVAVPAQALEVQKKAVAEFVRISGF